MPAADQSPVADPHSVIPPAKEASRISGMFDAIADRYDFLNHLLSAGLDRQWRKRAVGALGLTGRETLLDLCTGTGDLALAATSGGRRAKRVIGIDFSSAMLQIARTKIQRTGLSRSAAPDAPPVVLVRGDATRIPLADASIDAATIGFGIRNVEQPAAACREIARILRPGGRLVILEFSLPRAPALRRVYLWYFRKMLPLVGRLVSKHPSAYTYLPDSVQAFPPPEEFSRQLRDAGFGTVRALSLTFGIMRMFVAVKSGARDPGVIIH
jgi:demethylmenaquinone methyltransferase / 2-methoxy-6-polyprenyl-1,4-benzoquinol methylase